LSQFGFAFSFVVLVGADEVLFNGLVFSQAGEGPVWLCRRVGFASMVRMDIGFVYSPIKEGERKYFEASKLSEK